MNEKKKSNIIFHPIISSIQKVALYETKSHFYLMGSNNTLTRFRVLKIDRLEPRELELVDDRKEYKQDEIRELVKMIDNENRNTGLQKGIGNTVAKVISAFGIIGFIRFLEGYYLILITKRRRVAVVGHHTIYKIEDTSMIYIPHDFVRLFHPDEQRYVKMFQSIDLSSNFYFSYSYDITHTLQNNMTTPKHFHASISTNRDFIPNKGFFIESNEFLNLWGSNSSTQNNGYGEETIDYAIRNSPQERFVWNSHLLKPVSHRLHQDWLLYIIHGFIGQSNVSVFGRSIYVTLIARRSNNYAGTRFLKRGANFDGNVANEVETEQIVHDSSASSLNSGRFSSFVQMRGSVPGHWSQDISKMVPKPTINIDLSDPFVEIAGAHFNELLKRYGSPIIILNLVKKREKKKHESILSQEMNMSVKYLNQFLPSQFHIHYISYDMARKSKGKEDNVMERLADIANTALIKTNIFQSLNPYYNKSQVRTIKRLHKAEYSFLFIPNNSQCQPENIEAVSNIEDMFDSLNDKKKYFINKGNLQTGIIRTNCIDCLDRTNTAQFAIGKCALGYQLYALGVLNAPNLQFDTDCVRMLEELYEDHGDTLALQYGGSQLVHRIKTYRKTAPWTSQGNDIMQTLSRYYSNTFSDQEKQQTINLFLGVFIPEEGKPSIWEILTDYYLHHKICCKHTHATKLLTQWWDKSLLKHLPYAIYEETKICTEIIRILKPEEEAIDIFYDYYRPYEISLLSEVFAFKISHSIRDFMPHFTSNYSPFAVRVRPGRRREEAGNTNATMRNPSLTGHSSTSSTASSASSSTTSSDDEETQYVLHFQSSSLKSCSEFQTFNTLFTPMKVIYGIELETPIRNHILTYKKYTIINNEVNYKLKSLNFYSKIFDPKFFNKLKSSKEQINSHITINIYKQHVKRSNFGPSLPISEDVNLYNKYILQTQYYNEKLHYYK